MEEKSIAIERKFTFFAKKSLKKQSKKKEEGKKLHSRNRISQLQNQVTINFLAGREGFPSV